MRATVATIDLAAIAYNIQQVKQRVHPAQVMAVVKANAYGHGAIPVAETALHAGATYLGVALVEEGIEIRHWGITAPILVLGGFFPDQIPAFLANDLEFTLYSEENLAALRQAAKALPQKPRVHVKIDTGMGRVGVSTEQAEQFVTALARTKEIELVGLYTHFATADENDKGYANWQLQCFREVIDKLERQGIQIPLKHAANSGAILDLPDSYFNMVRPGIMIYGYYPSPTTSESLLLRPAMTLKSRVLFVKEVAASTSISYGRKFITQQSTRIATVPLGYADGYNRLLFNRSKVAIAGQIHPVVGRVCMDQILVDVGLDSPVAVGDEVVLFGPGYGREVSVTRICELLETIPYEVCCWVSYRVPRVFLNDTVLPKVAVEI